MGGRRQSRRWFLGAAAGAAGAAGIGGLACTGGSKKPATPTNAGGGTETPGADSSATPTKAVSGKHGGTLRYTGFVLSNDGSEGRYDPHKTQASPFYGQQALVFSRLLAFPRQADGAAVADLALSLPEQPDAQTFVFRLNPAARWHDRAPLNGREVTADDVKHSIMRQLEGDASFVRKGRWAAIDAIEVTSPTTITFKLKAPNAAMIHAFADVNSFIVAPELTKDGPFTLENQTGSGPFRWVEWSEGKFASVARNGAWHGPDKRPYLDGVEIYQPSETAEVEAWLRVKKLDVALVGRPQAQKLKGVIPQLQEDTVGLSRFFGMRFFIPQFPYQDPRFRSALTYAVDRRAMIQQFFAGSGEVNPWISWPITRWSLPQAELANLPGFRAGTAGRAQDIKEAKALLDAFLGEHKVTQDQLVLIVVDDAETNLHMGELMQKQIKEALNLDIKVAALPAADVGQMLLTNKAPWVAGPDDGWIDLDDWVHPFFHSEGTKNTFPLRDTDMDNLINSQRVELNEDRRRQVGYEIQRKLLSLNVAANFVSERVVALSWPYVRGFPLDAADGYQHRFSETWMDQGDPAFRGRP